MLMQSLSECRNVAEKGLFKHTFSYLLALPNNNRELVSNSSTELEILVGAAEEMLFGHLYSHY